MAPLGDYTVPNVNANRSKDMKDFNAKTRRILANKGIQLIGIFAIPDSKSSFANARRAYRVNDNGTGRVWTYHEVIDAAI